MIKIGIIGINEGNGHPYSFSAIINGFNEKEFKKSEWINIYNYLKERDKSDFGICDVKVTHIWTQDKKESEKIAKATFIENIVDNFEDMIEEIDAVMILRDDYESHFKFAKPFLEAGKFVFIDKPLSLNYKELEYFKPFIENKKLFSASGIKYARELDFLKTKNENFKFIRATCVKDWDRYGIHMLDGIFSVVDWDVKEIKKIKNNYFLLCEDDKIIEICMLGKYHLPIFKFEFFGEDYYQIEIKDYFMAFKRLIQHFIFMVKYKNESNKNVLKVINILIKGCSARFI